MTGTVQDDESRARVPDVPLTVEDVLLELDDLVTTDGDPVAIGELWMLALELLGG